MGQSGRGSEREAVSQKPSADATTEPGPPCLFPHIVVSEPPQGYSACNAPFNPLNSKNNCAGLLVCVHTRVVNLLTPTYLSQPVTILVDIRTDTNSLMQYAAGGFAVCLLFLSSHKKGAVLRFQRLHDAERMKSSPNRVH